MESRASVLLLCLILFSSLSSPSLAFDITKILSQYPDFTQFNSFLTETKVADQINARKTVTVLVFDNSVVDELSDKPVEVAKKIISNHVLLDYYDVQKLSQLPEKTALLPTLLQSAGQMGSLNVSLVGEGELAFGSGVKGAPVESKLVKSVMSEANSISVLQITEPIIAPGIDSSGPTEPTTDSQTNDPNLASKVIDAANNKLPQSSISPLSSISISPSSFATAPGPSGSVRNQVSSGLLCAGLVLGLVSALAVL